MSSGATSRSTAGENGLRLHLGCGANAPDGWVNVDKSFGPAIERLRLRKTLEKLGVLNEAPTSLRWPTNVQRLDVTKEWPWANGSADAIYSSHMIEHFTPRETEQFLKNSFRVLAPGGVIRLAVPDLEFSVGQYLAARDEGRPDAADHLNSLFYNMPDTSSQPAALRVAVKLLHRPHAWMYDFSSLASRLCDAGFIDIARAAHGEGRLPQVELLDVRGGRSLFVEGLRP